MSKHNAQEVLKTVENMILESETKPRWMNRYKIEDVCDELSIFDWWNDYLSKSQLKDMRKFLKEAIKLGYTGYVCFKVGATGCANGMWAHKAESTDGYSPKGEALYKSFTPSYNYWSVCDANGVWAPAGDDEYDSIKTVKQLEEYIANMSIITEEEEEMEENMDALNSKTVKELRTEAKAQGVKNASKMKKDELIALLAGVTTVEISKVHMYAFTGMYIGEFDAEVRDGKIIVNTARKGELVFDLTTGKEITTANKARYANKVERA